MYVLFHNKWVLGHKMYKNTHALSYTFNTTSNFTTFTLSLHYYQIKIIGKNFLIAQNPLTA